MFLPTRPPTPPKDISRAVDDAIRFLDDSNEVDRVLQNPRSAPRPDCTPRHQSPPSSQEPLLGSRGTKKVGFTPCPTYLQAGNPAYSSSPTLQARDSLPWRKDAKPLKSILKQSSNPPPLTPDDLESKISYFSPQVPGSFSKMLQSVIQQLAGQTVSNRLDAYLALNGALKAYEGVPEPDAMAAKMDLLMQFISRDVAWKNNSGSLDVNIVTQALKLVVTILFNQKLAAALDDDFRTFLVDRSITVIDQADMPKAVVKTHLFLLAQQRFRSSVVTSGRAEKIIHALQTIEERCSGNSIVATRLVIYQRLLEQATGTMLGRMRDWLEPVIHCMLSSVKDVRIRAIEMCTQAGLQLGTQPHASKALLDVFQAEVEDSQSYCDFMSLRLMQMISERELGPYVPQIWSAVILFFRNKRSPLEKWPNFKTWLLIIQKCLNSSNLTVRYQGHLAWNKLVFTIQPDASVGRIMFGMLKVPPTMGMDKKGADQQSKQIRQYALESYYNLLHYALRPGLSYHEIDSAWDSFVEPVLSGMIKANNKGRYIACKVLHGIFTVSSGLWNVDAALDTLPVKPEELPRLEPRWVRSRLTKVMKLVEPILASAMWMPPEATAAPNATWHSLMQSLVDAGSQEVRTSNELKEAMALLADFFRRLWVGCAEPSADADPFIFLDRFATLLSTAVNCVGNGPFNEDILVRTKDKGIQPALTPSHRASKHHIPPRSLLVLTFGLYYETPECIKKLPGLSKTASRTLQLLTAGKPTPATRMELLHRSAQTWFAVHTSEALDEISSTLWSCIAQCASDLLQAGHSSESDQSSQSLGQELRNACSILLNGLKYTNDSVQSSVALNKLLHDMMSLANSEAGNNGVVLGVFEPLAKTAVEAGSSLPYETKLHLGTAIVSKASWPARRQDIDQARRALWGVGLAPHKTATFDAFDFTYNLIVDILIQSYDSVQDLTLGTGTGVASFVQLLMSFLRSCPAQLVANALQKTQDGLSVWILDETRKTSAGDGMRELVCSSWDEIILLLQKMPEKSPITLRALEPLLVAGFSSPHKGIVNQSINFWNGTFGSNESLECPNTLAKVLRTRAADADISLPGLSIDDEIYDDSLQLPAFFESQTTSFPLSKRPIEAVPQAAASKPDDSRDFPSSEQLQDPESTSVSATALHRRKESGGKARLRHDDSQLHFAPIESSPVHFEDSQMLTERQKEIKARQHENAQMFPELSSSPVVKQSTTVRKLEKRLDFNSESAGEEPIGTPTGPPDANAPMSDDNIPSSPTPSSAKDPGSAQIEMHDSDTELAQDPPSSPPREDDEDFGTGGAVFETAPARIDSDLPSDTPLPNEQLQREQEQAAEGDHPEFDPDATEGTTFAPPSSTKQRQQRAPGKTNETEVPSKNEPVDVDISRIEDSFVELPPPENAESPEASQQSQPNSKKRKRSSTKFSSTKKRKSQSPFKAVSSFFSNWVRRSQSQDNDENMEEEIVVASSQPSESPESKNKAHKTRSPIVEVPSRKEDQNLSKASEAASEEVEGVQESQLSKRGRRRARRSQASQRNSQASSQQSEAIDTRGLKRKATDQTEASNQEQDSPSDPVETSQPQASTTSKTRKQRQGQDAKLVQRAQQNAEEAGPSRSTRRKNRNASKEAAVAASTPQPSTSAPVPEERPTEHEAEAAPEQTKDNLDSDPTLGTERPIATPTSIMGKLRNILGDLSKSFLGGQEEREMDDVLFEIRQEVHEAARRGRQRDGKE
ncbi:hypothetical protein D0869_02109 [Hortaea werneckii]|uniref:Telomere-associated protein Rif1 N-terminal domain-containing protein n=1 Tax=Hortaea werneckii TaxID=91943 RepID=A0A3M6XBC1_HORWE|nr:hypothetical protein D0869_02109 [Hortaea werneckii]